MKKRHFAFIVFILLPTTAVIALVISKTVIPPLVATPKLKNSPAPSSNMHTNKTSLPTPPPSKILENNYHIFQSFNNCGPAALSMALSYFDIQKSQQELGQALRPYQNPQGDNDDKSVTLEELAQEAEKYGLIAYHRPNGNIALIKKFIAADIPVVTRTWLKEHEDIGHYRIVKGYDDNTQELIQDDSLQGKNLRYSYKTFNDLWQKYNYEFLVLVPKEKQKEAESILGEIADPKIAWEKAVKDIEKTLETNPDDIYALFNLSVALYHTGDYQKSVEAYEQVADRLPKRTLWYQIEPIQAYFALGNYEKVFSLTDAILENQNRAFSEIYLLRGEIYKKQGNLNAAKREFEKAVLYNKNLLEAQNALSSLE